MALHTLLPSTWYKLPCQPVGLACLSLLTDAHGRILPTDAFVLQLPSFNWTSSLQTFYFPVLFLVWLCSALIISAHAQMILYIRTHFVDMRHIYLGYHCHFECFLSNRGSRNNWFEKFVPGTRNHGHTVKLPFLLSWPKHEGPLLGVLLPILSMHSSTLPVTEIQHTFIVLLPGWYAWHCPSKGK